MVNYLQLFQHQLMQDPKVTAIEIQHIHNFLNYQE